MKKLIICLLIITMVNIMIFSTSYASSVKDFDKMISDVEKEIELLSKDIVDFQKAKNGETENKRDIEFEIIRKKEIIKLMEDNIEKKENDLLLLQEDILNYHNEIKTLEEKIILREDGFRDRVNTIYGNDKVNFIDVILSSNSLSDMLSKVFSYKKIVENDNNILEEYVDLSKELSDKRVKLEDNLLTLEDRISELNEMTFKVEYDKRELDRLHIVKNNNIEEISKLLDGSVGELERLEKEKDRIREEKEQWLKEEEERKRKEEEERKRLAKINQSTSNKGILKSIGRVEFIVPSEGRITSEFGPRWGTTHRGLDIGTPTGTAVYASADGIVTYVGYWGTYGNLVKVEHNINGVAYETRYAHLNAFNVQEGQSVNQGDIIALSGDTGNSTGPHLHFEIIRDGTVQDPLLYLKFE